MRSVVCIWLVLLLCGTASAKSSLHELVQQGDSQRIAAAITANNINKPDKQGNAPIHYAAARANAEVVKLLIARGSDVNVLNKKYRTTPLHEIARTVQKARAQIADTTRTLLANGASPALVDSHGESPMIAAARAGNAVVIQTILDSSTNSIELADIEHALLIARQFGRYEVISLLEARGIASDSGKERGLLNAASLGNYTTADNLVSSGANLETRAESSETPLILAAMQGHEELVRFLVGRGANVNAQDKDGRTALHAAAARGHLEIIKLLLANRASINASSPSVGTPLNIAAKKEWLTIANYLLEQGGTPVTVDASADEAFGSGLGWLLFADFHAEAAPATETEMRKETAREMLQLANLKLEEQLQLYQKMRRSEKRTEAMLNIVASAIAAAAVIGLERLQQQQIDANRRQTAKIMALGDASSYNDYHRRYKLYEAAMIDPIVQAPYQVNIADPSLANKESISGLDVIITEYERRIALTKKLLDSVQRQN